MESDTLDISVDTDDMTLFVGGMEIDTNSQSGTTEITKLVNSDEISEEKFTMTAIVTDSRRLPMSKIISPLYSMSNGEADIPAIGSCWDESLGNVDDSALLVSLSDMKQDSCSLQDPSDGRGDSAIQTHSPVLEETHSEPVESGRDSEVLLGITHSLELCYTEEEDVPIAAPGNESIGTGISSEQKGPLSYIASKATSAYANVASAFMEGFASNLSDSYVDGSDTPSKRQVLS
jgi:hypothetical protein